MVGRWDRMIPPTKFTTRRDYLDFGPENLSGLKSLVGRWVVLYTCWKLIPSALAICKRVHLDVIHSARIFSALVASFATLEGRIPFCGLPVTEPLEVEGRLFLGAFLVAV